jgi:hypothetical protein
MSTMPVFYVCMYVKTSSIVYWLFVFEYNMQVFQHDEQVPISSILSTPCMDSSILEPHLRSRMLRRLPLIKDAPKVILTGP